MNKIRIIIATIFGLMTGSTFAQGASSVAEGASMFTPALNSQAEKIMGQMFGGISSIDGANPLLDLIQNINAITLIIAGILITYQIMNGLIATAHEGEFLGKRLNAATYPLRISIATAVIVPVVKGYAIVQIVVMWLVTQSIGFADQTWISYISKQNFSEAISVSMPSPQTKDMADSILESLVCVESLRKITNLPEGHPLYTKNNWGIHEVQNDTNKVRYVFGDLYQGHGFTVDQCGYIEIPTPKNLVADKNIAEKFGDIYKGYTNTVTGSVGIKVFSDKVIPRETELIAIQSAVGAAHRREIDRLISSTQLIANKIINDENYKINGADFSNIISEYNKQIKNAATSEIKRYNPFKSIIEKAEMDGFISSMFLYNKMADLADIVSRSVVMKSTYEKPKTMTNPTFKDQYTTDMLKVKGKLISSDVMVSNASDGDDSMEGKMNRWLDQKISEHIDGGMFQINPGEHPIMAAKRIGTNVLSVITSLTTALGIGATVFPMASTTLLTILSGIWTAGLPLILFTLVIIPLTPVLYILGSIIAWVTSVVEAVIVAPFWAVMHIVHGDDMLGSGEKGYKLLLNILLKPVMIVVGVIASFSLIMIFTSFIASNYGAMMEDMAMTSNTGALTKFFYMIASIYIITILNFTIMMSIFKLIFQLPDRIMQWITNSENTLGGSAQDIAGVGGTAAKITTAGAGLAGNIAGKGLGGIANQRANQIASEKSTNKSKEEAFNKLPASDKLNNFMKKEGYGGSDSLSNVKASSEVNGMSQQLDGLGGGMGEQFASSYNQERGENGTNADHSTAFSNALTKTFASNFDAGSPEMKLAGAMAGDPKTAMMGVQAISKLQKFGENRGMLSNDISNSISSFASNVAKGTKDFTEGNLSEVMGNEYYKTKNSMAGAM